jgi:hypothetical protein
MHVTVGVDVAEGEHAIAMTSIATSRTIVGACLRGRRRLIFDLNDAHLDLRSGPTQARLGCGGRASPERTTRSESVFASLESPAASRS